MRFIHTSNKAAPGLPPRPGLRWKEETHRWIRPNPDEPSVMAHQIGYSGQAVSEHTPEEILDKVEEEGLRVDTEPGEITSELNLFFDRPPAVYSYSIEQWADSHAMLMTEDVESMVFIALTPTFQKSTKVYDDELTHAVLKPSFKPTTAYRQKWHDVARNYGEDISHINTPEFATTNDIPPSNIILGRDIVRKVPAVSPQEKRFTDNYQIRHSDVVKAVRQEVARRASGNLLKILIPIHVWAPEEGQSHSQLLNKAATLIPYKTMVYPKSGKPYMSTRYRRPHDDGESPTHVVPAAAYQGDLMQVYQSWQQFLNQYGEVTDALLKPIVALQEILFKGHAGVIAIQDNRVIGVATLNDGKNFVAASPLDQLQNRDARIEDTLTEGLKAYEMS